MDSNKTNNKYPFFNFSSVNRRVNPVLLKDDELLDLVNFYSPKLGAKRVRYGYEVFLNNPDNSPVKSLVYVKFPNPSFGKKLIRFSSNKIYAVDPNSASSWGSSLYTHSVNFNRPEATVLAGKVHIVDQTSSASYYIEYNGSTFTNTNYTSGTDVVVPHRAKTITTYHRRVYVGNSYYPPDFHRSRISWSSIDYVNKGTSPASPFTIVDDDISSANYRTIDMDYKGNIIKLTNINDRLNIYKEEGIYRYNESSVFILFGLSPYDGSIATMEETREDFFLTNEGFFKTDGQKTVPIGVGWYPIIKKILKNGIDTSKITSYAVNFKYYCYLGNITYDGVTKTNALFVYDALIDEMWLWSLSHDVTCFGHYVDSSGDKRLLFGSSNGYVYRFNESLSKDAGVPYQAYFTTKYFFFNDPTVYKKIDNIYGFTGVGQEIEVYADVDYNNSYKPLLSISGYHSTSRINYDELEAFREISFKIQWNGVGERPLFKGFIISFKSLSERL